MAPCDSIVVLQMEQAIRDKAAFTTLLMLCQFKDAPANTARLEQNTSCQNWRIQN